MINGKDAVPFMSLSNLPKETLRDVLFILFIRFGKLHQKEKLH